MARLLEEAEQVSRARLLAAVCRESGVWLHTLPTSTLRTLLDSEALRIALALRVGAVVSPMCAAVVGEWTRGGVTGSCMFSAGDIQDIRF